MDLEDGAFGYRFFSLGNVLDEGDGLVVVDGFQMFAQAFPADGQSFFYDQVFYDQGRFLQGQRVALDAVAFVGVFDGEGFFYLAQGFSRQGAQRDEAGFQLVYLSQYVIATCHNHCFFAWHLHAAFFSL